MPKKRPIYAFKPPMHFLTRGMTKPKLEMLLDSLEKISFGAQEHVPQEILQRLNPVIRERLVSFGRPVTGDHIARVAGELAAVRRLRSMGPGGKHIRGLRFIPAEVHLIPSNVKEEYYPELYFNPQGLPENTWLHMWAHALPVEKGHIIRFYTMQRSSIPKGSPAWVRRLYGYGAPTLGLALLSRALAREGSGRILVPGTRYASMRKGIKSPMTRFLLKERAEKGNKTAGSLLRDWDRLTEQELYDKIHRMEGGKAISKAGLSPMMIHRYYHRIPSRLPSRITELSLPLSAERHIFHEIDLDALQPLDRFMRKKTE